MTAVRRFQIVLLSALALLFAGVANVHAHVHLCLDGQPPVVVPLEEGGAHHQDEHDGEHHDDHRAGHHGDSHGHSGGHSHGNDHNHPFSPHLDHHPVKADSHQDVDVDVPAQAIAQPTSKALKVELPLLGPAPALISLDLPAAATGTAAQGPDDRPRSALCLLRPPVRGPPL